MKYLVHYAITMEGANEARILIVSCAQFKSNGDAPRKGDGVMVPEMQRDRLCWVIDPPGDFRHTEIIVTRHMPLMPDIRDYDREYFSGACIPDSRKPMVTIPVVFVMVTEHHLAESDNLRQIAVNRFRSLQNSPHVSFAEWRFLSNVAMV